MCGLVGIAGNVYGNDLTALKWLLFFDAIRGEDSTGLAVVEEEKNNIELYKSVGGPHCLFYEYLVFDKKNTYAGKDGKVFIGHNRAATRGEVTEANAHPFHHGNIVGAHNGTLIDSCLKRLEDGEKYEVDSEAVIFNFSKGGIKDTISKLEGAWAFTVYDKEQDKMFFIRNSSRPLYYARRLDNDVMYWSSSEEILKMALGLAKVHVGDIKQFEPNKLYSLDMKNSNLKFRDVKLEIADADVRGFTYPITSYGGTGRRNPFVYGDDWSGDDSYDLYKGQRRTSTTIPQSSLASTMIYPSKAEIKTMKLLVGKTVQFKFSDSRRSVQGIEYISAYPLSQTCDWDIRVHPAGDIRAQEWRDSKHNVIWEGRVKRFVRNEIAGKREAYLSIDLRTIKRVLIKSQPSVDTLPPSNTTSDHKSSGLMLKGFNDKWLTEYEWHQATTRGCAWCSASPSTAEHDKLRFLSDNEFICGDCNKDEAVLEFISQYK